MNLIIERIIMNYIIKPMQGIDEIDGKGYNL